MKKTILLVEDETIIALAQTSRLKKYGFDVISVTNGPSAIDLVNSSKKVDLILMDIDLGPGQMDGTETAAEILKNNEIPVIFLSSHIEPEVVEKTEKITSYGYIVKNSGDTILTTSIKMAFKLFEANREIKKRREESEKAYYELEFREIRLQHMNRILRSFWNINQIITKDTEKSELLKKTCEFLIETSGYQKAWIILLDNDKPVEPFYYSGFNETEFTEMSDLLKSGKYPVCAKNALRNENLSVIDDPINECIQCPLRFSYTIPAEGVSETANITARIEHNNLIYGWLSVSVPRTHASETDEHKLLSEIVKELGYALHKIDVEHARDRAFTGLREHEHLLSDVFSSIQDGISVLDNNLTILQTNDIMKSWYAKSGPLEGQKCFQCFQKRDTPCDPCPSLRSIDSGKVETNVIPGPPNSPIEWTEIFSYPIINRDSGKTRGVVEFVRDITERKNAIEALHKAKYERDTILDSLVEHVIYEDKDLRIKWPNTAACESVALDREDLIGRYCYEIWPNRDSPCPDCPVLRAIETGKPQSIEKSTPDGKWWFIRGYPVRDESGEIIGAVEVTLDISERKIADSRLAQNEESLRSTLQSIGDAVIATDLNGYIVNMNPVAEYLTGWRLNEAFEKSLTSVFQIVNAKTRKACANPYDEVLKTGKKVGLANDTILISKNGKEYQIADSAAPIRDPIGNISGVVLVFRDVTEEYQMREDLKKSEDRLSKTLFAANDGTWDWDLETNVVYFDKRYYEMSGYECNEFPHEFDEFRKRVHPDDVDSVLETADQHLQGLIDQFNVEFRFARKNGDWMWILGRGKIVEKDSKGIPKRFIGTHTDITERKQIEKALRIEKRRLTDVLLGTNIGTWEWNVQTGEIVINQRWAEIIGYTLEEVSPTTFETWGSFVHPDDLEKSNILLSNHFVGELDYYECEVRMKHKNGSWVWVLDRGKVSSRTENGEPILMSGTHQDISDRKKSESTLVQAIEAKEHLYKELQHRVKNNLNMIISMINLQASASNTPESKHRLESIASRVNALAELYTFLYQYDSIDIIQLNLYFMNIIDSLKSFCSHISFSTRIEDITCPHKTAASLGLILTELITNAIKHSFPDNKVGIIQVNLKRVKERIRLEVTNDGIPLPTDFDLSSTTGMGLKLVQVLVDQHSGSLRCLSGKTTSFVADLIPD